MFEHPINLTPSQETVLQAEPNTIVYGPAGSGKTLLTILLAEKLISKEPKALIKIVVLTNSLKDYIKRGLNQREIKQVNICNSKDAIKDYSDVDYCIIDEAHDFNLNQIKKIISRANKGVYILADPNQQIYNLNDEKPDIKKILATLNFPVIELKEVVRYTQAIHNFIGSIFTYLDEYKTILKGDVKPQIIRYKSAESKAQEIIDLIKQQKAKGDVAILVQKNKEVDELVNLFKNNNFLIDGFKNNSESCLHLGDNKANILTIHSAKGLEFNSVIIPFFDRPNVFQDVNLYYVAFSRAKEELFILYEEHFPLIMAIRDRSTYEGELVKNIEAIKFNGLINLKIKTSKTGIELFHEFKLEQLEKELAIKYKIQANQSTIGLEQRLLAKVLKNEFFEEMHNAIQKLQEYGLEETEIKTLIDECLLEIDFKGESEKIKLPKLDKRKIVSYINNEYVKYLKKI